MHRTTPTAATPARAPAPGSFLALALAPLPALARLIVPDPVQSKAIKHNQSAAPPQLYHRPETGRRTKNARKQNTIRRRPFPPLAASPAAVPIRYTAPAPDTGASPRRSQSRRRRPWRSDRRQRRRSSAVEQLFRKQQVTGSNPIAGSTHTPDARPPGVRLCVRRRAPLPVDAVACIHARTHAQAVAPRRVRPPLVRNRCGIRGVRPRPLRARARAGRGPARPAPSLRARRGSTAAASGPPGPAS